MSSSVSPSRIALAFSGVVGLSVVALLDRATGTEIAFSIFYVLPIALCVWRGENWHGWLLALIAAGMWLAVDVTSHEASHPLIHVWNAIVRLSFFSIIVALSARLRRAKQREAELARTDPLTELANARSYYERLEAEIARMQRSGQPLTIAYLDLDDFKEVNDTHGHRAGDRVLRLVATTLKEEVRATDVVARLGGDEFSVLLPDTDRTGAEVLLARALGRVGQALARHDWPVTLSAGAVTFGEPPASADVAVHQADALMYEVKKAGKGSIRWQRGGAR